MLGEYISKRLAIYYNDWSDKNKKRFNEFDKNEVIMSYIGRKIKLLKGNQKLNCYLQIWFCVSKQQWVMKEKKTSHVTATI